MLCGGSRHPQGPCGEVTQTRTPAAPVSRRASTRPHSTAILDAPSADHRRHDISKATISRMVNRAKKVCGINLPYGNWENSRYPSGGSLQEVRADGNAARSSHGAWNPVRFLMHRIQAESEQTGIGRDANLRRQHRDEGLTDCLRTGRKPLEGYRLFFSIRISDEKRDGGFCNRCRPVRDLAVFRCSLIWDPR